MAANIEIIIGTYEEFILGYKVEIKNEKTALTQSFADKSHSGSIRCVAVQERWVATGATDDRIFIYDMSTRKQSQIILSHDGTVNSLAFTPDGTHLLSGGDDGRMIATRLKTWFTEATWKKAHNGSPVTHISCHPSGKLALSLGSDLVLRTWNLVKGRVAYKTNLKSRNTLGARPDCLAWSPTGDYFTISGQRVVEFWSIKTAEVVRSQKTKSKPICVSWIADDVCLVGLEDGKILWLTVDTEEEKEIVAHDSRVKAIHVFKQNLVTASSSGEIKLWQILENKQKLKEIASTNIGCRPTCISILDLEQFGDNYIISNTIGVKERDIKPTTSRAKAPQRGIVTIEYENNDEDNKEESDTDKGKVKKEDSSDDEESEEEKDEDSWPRDDNDMFISPFNTPERVVHEDDSEDYDAEDGCRIPNSRERREFLELQERQNKLHALEIACRDRQRKELADANAVGKDEDDDDDSLEDDDSDEEDAEEEVRLPKSRKHKLQVLKCKEIENKKQMVKKSNKRQKKESVKKPQQQQQQLKKGKQKQKK